MQRGHFEETRATARLPNLDIEIIHSRSAEGDAERLSISLQAIPSFEAFGRYLESANPFLFWMRVAQTAWAPWLGSAPASLLSGTTATFRQRQKSPAQMQRGIAIAGIISPGCLPGSYDSARLEQDDVAAPSMQRPRTLSCASK